MIFTPLATRLLEWYAQNARQLPWRNHPNPYAVWISEIMLQQTRVETVIPYFERWMKQFPTLEVLAEASQQEVLAVWEGLGYYSRARNLHRAAQLVVSDYGGTLPADLAPLRRLPGIGRYTAAAIAAIAFGLDEVALDGNVRRLMARLFDVSQPSNSAQGERRLRQLATENLPPAHAGDYNQAMMDLGATFCKPRQPACPTCPLTDLCLAYARGVQSERPVRLARPKLPHYTVTAAVIRRNGQVLIAQRPPNGLLGGLWEFPGGKTQTGEDLSSALQREIREELGITIRVGESLGVYRHAFTHFRITLYAFDCVLEDGEPQPLEHTALQWTAFADLSTYPMGKVDRQIASSLPLYSHAPH